MEARNAYYVARTGIGTSETFLSRRSLGGIADQLPPACVHASAHVGLHIETLDEDDAVAARVFAHIYAPDALVLVAPEAW